MAASSNLSPREVEVLKLLIRGMTVASIANQLGITADAAQGRLRQCYKTLEVCGMVEAAVAWLDMCFDANRDNPRYLRSATLSASAALKRIESAGLTECQREAAGLLATGLVVPAIAGKTLKSDDVRGRLGRAYRKLRVSNRVQLAVLWWQAYSLPILLNGIASTPET